MTNPDDDMSAADRTLMQALAQAIGGPQPPVDLVARCEGLLAWIDVDSELAVLLDQPVAEAAGTRGAAAAPTTIEFAVDDGSCVIELTPSDHGIHGQLLGREATSVVVRSTSAPGEQSPVDDLGEFELGNTPSGAIRLEFELSDGRRIHTDWFVI